MAVDVATDLKLLDGDGRAEQQDNGQGIAPLGLHFSEQFLKTGNGISDHLGTLLVEVVKNPDRSIFVRAAYRYAAMI